ncbi:hypothetical protein [Thalassovita mediterranea]|jgi:hypothetical protein|uniref:Uncharacterized protein n=1 Tax=Thalassovita mediterranea TaxID=340021 RepID=A0A0P1GSH9_9RHOB|nr:hypothetical protein [Thalassovita mediterranea]CUH85552.1 hypothetical protein TM5383_02786 [Thalassovita mediterranea]SIS30194.1 hypothetical protein SAMN05421685_102264 [Thalassovita mediterranea]
MRQIASSLAGRPAHHRANRSADRPLLLSILSETGIFDTGLSDSYSLERMIDRLDQRETL